MILSIILGENIINKEKNKYSRHISIYAISFIVLSCFLRIWRFVSNFRRR